MRPSGTSHSIRRRAVIWIFIYKFLILCIFLEIGGASELWAAADEQHRELIEKAIDLYNRNALEDALKTFKEAAALSPENPVISYYLGLIHLAGGDREAAVKHWKTYVEQVPEGENTLTVRKHITLLQRNSYKAFARKAIADEAELPAAAPDNDAVVVTAFKNLGSRDLNPLGKGMAAMIIADLSHFKDLKVLEREKLQALLAEMALGGSGLVDEKSVPRIGRLLKAKYVTSGSLVDPEKERLQLNSFLLDTALNTAVGPQTANGELKHFYALEKKLACRIATDLGRNCSKAPQAFGKIHTKSLAAFSAYAFGLDYLDEEKYDEARAMFLKALDEDPQFDLARAAVAATPFAAMLVMTESQILSNASAGAPSSATATASSVGAGGLGIGTTTAVAGGAVVAGGVLAVAQALSENDGEPSDKNQVSFEGQWRGTWNDETSTGGGFVLNLTQSDKFLGGEALITGSQCLDAGNVSGRYAGDRVTLEITSADSEATLTAETTSDYEMNGTLAFNSGQCAGAAISVSIAKTGSAIVRW